ncbi:MAG: protein-L-isoaspartate(D-aspartate) O-methyltransferase [Gammaproteobacteria bacterium]
MSGIKYRGIGMTSQRTRDRLIQRLKEEGIASTMVLEVIRNTPRHIFVDEALASRAYDDTSLPIGHGQTISQPYVVARMTESLLRDGPLNKVLEIGTGSGYQAAVLAQVANEVFTVERIAVLISNARQRFQGLRLRNIRVKHADGMIGWPDQAPFDGILATAAPEGIPPALLAQLAVGGRLVIPVGDTNNQTLVMITRTPEGYRDEVLDQVTFVPMRAGTQ